MRFLHVGQRKALVDVDLHITAFHRGEKIVSHGLGRLAAAHVHEQGLACEVEAALLRQHGGRTGGTGPEALPKLTIRPKGIRQSSEPSKVSLPTESYTTLTPAPPVISRTRSAKFSVR